MTPQPMLAPGWIDLLGLAIPFSSLHANEGDRVERGNRQHFPPFNGKIYRVQET